MMFKKLITWFRALDDRPDPVLPRLWHGPATPVPKGFNIPAEDLAKLGIDPARVAKFQSFRSAEVWLNTDVIAAHDDLQKDPSSGLTVDEVRASLAKTRRRSEITSP